MALYKSVYYYYYYYYKRAEEMRVNGWENDKRIGNGRERKENGKGVKGLE